MVDIKSLTLPELQEEMEELAMENEMELMQSVRLDMDPEELEQLKNVKMPEIAERIKVARGFGDLSENSEYNAAREEQSSVAARIQELEELLKTAKAVDTSTLDPDVVHVGSTVRFFYSAFNEERVFRIVGSAEGSGDSQGIKNITNESPIGKALMDHRVGDVVDVHTPRGVFQMKILEVHLH